MELQVSHSVCAEVQTESILWREEDRDTRDIEDTMPMERSRSDRGRDMSWSYTHVGKYPAQNERSRIHGIFEREKQLDDISEMGNMKFAYRNREFWCKGYYVDTVGKNTNAIKEYIANQLKQDREREQQSMFDPRDPFTGSK